MNEVGKAEADCDTRLDAGQIASWATDVALPAWEGGNKLRAEASAHCLHAIPFVTPSRWLKNPGGRRRAKPRSDGRRFRRRQHGTKVQLTRCATVTHNRRCGAR